MNKLGKVLASRKKALSHINNAIDKTHSIQNILEKGMKRTGDRVRLQGKYNTKKKQRLKSRMLRKKKGRNTKFLL